MRKLNSKEKRAITAGRSCLFYIGNLGVICSDSNYFFVSN